jgi:hypothetical protein
LIGSGSKITSPTQRWISALPWLTAAVPFLVIAYGGFPAGDDWQFELTRIAAYAQALGDRQWPPFWAPHLYGGYGSPAFLFYGQVFVALASAAGTIAGSHGLGFLLALALSSAAAVWFLQLTAAELNGGVTARAAGRVAVYAFLLNPYPLADLLRRNAAAEYCALCVAPLAIGGLWLRRRDPWRGVIWLALGFALVSMTHVLVASALCALLLPLEIALMCHRSAAGTRWIRLGQLGLAAGLALALSAFAWLPALVLSPLIRSDDLLAGKFDWRLQFQGHAPWLGGEQGYGAGLLPLLAAGAACFAIAGRSRAPRDPAASLPILALLGGCALLVFIETPLAMPLWEHLPLLAYFQFPWRFMGPLALGSALLASCAFATLTQSISERRRAQLELLIASVCALNALPTLQRAHLVPWAEVAAFERRLEPSSERALLMTSTVGDEYLPRAAQRSGIARSASAEPIPSASPNLRIALRLDTPRELVLDVRADRDAELCLARWSFPFWSVRVDDAPQPITACRNQTLRVAIPAGKHHVVARLTSPTVRRVGLGISLLGLIIVIAWLTALRRRAR